jgi:thioredoxin 1
MKKEKILKEIVQSPSNMNAPKTPVHLDADTFDSTISKSEIPVLVDFWAPWCGPCRMVAPILDRIAEKYTGRLLVAKLNTDDHPAIAQKFNITGIPTMIFFDKGEAVKQLVGALPENRLSDEIDKIL